MTSRQTGKIQMDLDFFKKLIANRDIRLPAGFNKCSIITALSMHLSWVLAKAYCRVVFQSVKNPEALKFLTDQYY